MHDYSSERHLDVDAERAWMYLSDVSNLPKYFSRMTSAEQVGPDEVHTTARVELPDGTRGSRAPRGSAGRTPPR